MQNIYFLLKIIIGEDLSPIYFFFGGGGSIDICCLLHNRTNDSILLRWIDSFIHWCVTVYWQYLNQPFNDLIFSKVTNFQLHHVHPANTQKFNLMPNVPCSSGSIITQDCTEGVLMQWEKLLPQKNSQGAMMILKFRY